VRIRTIKPSFWQDAVIERLPDAVKLFYIGTWQLADDGGTFEWNVPEIGHALYGYQPRAKRERWVEERGSSLVMAGRLVIHECGHAFVPNLLKHQRIGGTKALTYSSAHLRCSPQDSDDLRPVREGKVEEGKGTEGVEGKPLTADQQAQIALNQSILDDPRASDEAKRVARKYLMKLGVAA
jgi:hypothetical protein